MRLVVPLLALRTKASELQLMPPDLVVAKVPDYSIKQFVRLPGDIVDLAASHATNMIMAFRIAVEASLSATRIKPLNQSLGG